MKYHYFYIAHNFLNLVYNVVGEMIKHGNKFSITTDYDDSLTQEEQSELFNEKIKWNDNNIGIPVLFNFYHGLELFMKGMLDAKGLVFESNHNLETLYRLIKEKEQYYPKNCLEILKKYVFINNCNIPFFKDNKITPNHFYLAFRYPVSQIKNGTLYKYKSIRGKEKETLKIYEEIIRDVVELKNTRLFN